MLIDTGKPRKTCVEVAGRRTFRVLTSSLQSSVYCLRNGNVLLLTSHFSIAAVQSAVSRFALMSCTATQQPTSLRFVCTAPCLRLTAELPFPRKPLSIFAIISVVPLLTPPPPPAPPHTHTHTHTQTFSPPSAWQNSHLN